MKAGDRVKINKGKSLGGNGWIPEMDEYVGKEATITETHDDDCDPIYKWAYLDIDNRQFGWNCIWLEVL